MRVRERQKKRYGVGWVEGQFTVQLARDNSRDPSNTAKHSISTEQHKARYKYGVINKYCTYEKRQ